MIDEKTALTQFNRLSEFDGFHRLTPESAEDLLAAIQSADNETVARRVIDDIKADELRVEMPTSGYLRHMIREENDRGKVAPSYPRDQIAEPKCRLCGDTGLELIQRGMYTGVQPCACRNPVVIEESPK